MAEEVLKNKETRPDIIFLDLLTKSGDGSGNISTKIDFSINFLKKIKSDEELKKIKVVVFSSFKEKEIQEKLLGLGADHYIVKGDLLPKEILNFVRELK